MGVNLAYLKTPSGVLKFLEIASVAVSFGLFRGSSAYFGTGASDADYFGGGVLVAAMMITPLLLACYLMGRTEIQKTIFEATFNLLMSIFLLASGSVAINEWKDRLGGETKRESMAMGSFCILSFLCYFADTVFAIKNYRK